MLVAETSSANVKKWRYCYGKSPFLTVTSVVCQPGTFHETVNTCSVCPVDTYQPLKGQSECHQCPKNSYQNETGSTGCKICDASANSENCDVCEVGKFINNQALEN